MHNDEDISFIEQVAEERAAEDPVFREMWAETKVGIALRQLRKQSGLSVDQVAEITGLSRAAVAWLERKPGAASLTRIRKYVGAVGGEFVLTGTGVREVRTKYGSES